MKNLLLTIFILFSLNLIYSQDVIVKKDGESINAIVVEIGVNEIKYYKYDNQNGPIYSISKKEVVIINFNNGTFELINTEPNKEKSISLEETKNIIVEYINNYAYWYEKRTAKKSYKAVFEEDYLILTVFNKSKTKEGGRRVYDFSNVYSFGDADKHRKDMTILDIWVDYSRHIDKDDFVKTKLIFKIKGRDNAVIIYNALKHYNKLLLEKKGDPYIFNNE